MGVKKPCSRLRAELERRITSGTCVYCRAPASPHRPLTREHVIPLARGGRRKDLRIVVPACIDCNRRRGSQELVLFLLARPRRLTTFLDYVNSLPPDAVAQMDTRVLAELYAAVWLLGESAARGTDWRRGLYRWCGGRRLHRRRYAARRIVAGIGQRLERVRDRASWPEGPSCLLPRLFDPDADAERYPPIRTAAGIVDALSLMWGVSAERVADELERERRKIAVQGQAVFEERALADAEVADRRRRIRRRRAS